jgi:hypothetical protein
MSCHECGFCQADVTALENVAVDTRARGNFRIAALLNQALERCGVLRENLQANDREYLKNVSRMVKKQPSAHTCTNILRDAKHVVEITKGRQSSKPMMREVGFGSMFAASRGISSTPIPKQTEPEFQSNSEFIRMLEESKKGTDEIEHDETKHPIERVIADTIPRQMGFGAMLDAVRPSRVIRKPEPETRGRYGFCAMLDGASRGTDMLESEALDKRQRVHRYMGFTNMLEGAARGTE